MNQCSVLSLLFCLGVYNSVVVAAEVTLHYDTDSSALSFAAERISSTLLDTGHSVQTASLKDAGNADSRMRIVLAVSSDPVARSILDGDRMGIPNTINAQGYSIRLSEHSGQMSLWVMGGDATGAMYGGLDLADCFQGGASLSEIEEVDKAPFIGQRGLKFNIPLDARTPSYSDNNIVAQANLPHMWDMDFWREFLDEMALNRLNRLTLWSLSPFPSMVRVPSYPKVGLDDVKRTTLAVDAFGRSSSGAENVTPKLLANLETVKVISLDEKIAFWREVMQYAKDRGVDVHIFTWNLFTFGTEGSGYGLTPDIRNEATKAYLRQAAQALLETYPLLKGLGITAGENMSHDDVADETFLFETYGRAINEVLENNPQRTFQLSHRLGDVLVAKEAFADLHPRCELSFTYKYSKAHVYSSVDPYWIHDHEFLEEIGEGTPYFVTIRDDSYNYLRGGSDPEFVRQYVRNIPNPDNRFRGFQLGPDAIVWGRENVSKQPDSPRQLMLKKRWYSLRIWGHLSYDPKLPDAHFQALLDQRFAEANSEHLFRVWATASRIVPLVNRFHNYKAYLDYQWNPELCDSRAGYNSETGFHDMDTFIRIKTQRGEGLVGIPEFIKGDGSGKTPFQVAEELLKMGDAVLADIEKVGGGNSADQELRQTLSDIRALGYLGLYYGHKIAASTHYAFFRETEENHHKEAAIARLQRASNAWWLYSHQLSELYLPMYYSRLRKHVDVLELQEQVDKEVLELGGVLPERPVAGRPGR